MKWYNICTRWTGLEEKHILSRAFVHPIIPNEWPIKIKNKKKTPELFIRINVPMLTILIPWFSRNFNATATFSSFCERNVGFLLCLGSRFWAKTSIRPTNFKPSERSVSRSVMWLLAHLRCSLAHLVNVFCCIRFHSASSANSRSTISVSCSACCSRLTALLWWWSCCCSFIFNVVVVCCTCLYITIYILFLFYKTGEEMNLSLSPLISYPFSSCCRYVYPL